MGHQLKFFCSLTAMMLALSRQAQCIKTFYSNPTLLWAYLIYLVIVHMTNYYGSPPKFVYIYIFIVLLDIQFSTDNSTQLHSLSRTIVNIQCYLHCIYTFPSLKYWLLRTFSIRIFTLVCWYTSSWQSMLFKFSQHFNKGFWLEYYSKLISSTELICTQY